MSHKIKSGHSSFTQEHLWSEICKYNKLASGVHFPNAPLAKTEIPSGVFVREDAILILGSSSREETAMDLRSRFTLTGLDFRDLDNDEKMLKLCLSDCRFFQIASARLRAKEIFVKQILTRKGELLEHVKGGLAEKEDVVAIAMYRSPAALKFASNGIKSSMRFLDMIQNILMLHVQARTWKDLTWPAFIQGEPLCNRDFAIRLVKINRVAFQYLDQKIREDQAVLWEAVRSNSVTNDFEYSPLAFTLKKNCVEELLLIEIKRNAEFIKYASDELKKNKAFVLEVLKSGNILSGEDYSILSHIDESLCDDDEVVSKAVEKNYMDIRFAGSRVKNKRDIFDQLIVSSSIDSFTMSGFYLLEIAGEDLRDDEEFVLKTIKNNLKEIQYASERVKNIREVALRATEGVDRLICIAGYLPPYSNVILNQFSESIRDDEEVVFAFVKKNQNELLNASQRIRNSVAIIRKFVAENKSCYEFAGEEIHNKYGTDVEVFIQASLGRVEEFTLTIGELR